MPLRSISLRLTIAFLFVGLFGAALVSVYVGLRTQSAMGEFYFDQQRGPLVAMLTEHYTSNGSWKGIHDLFPGDYAWIATENGRPLAVTVTDANGKVLVGTIKRSSAITIRTIAQRSTTIPLRANGEVVGYLVYDGQMTTWQPDTPESDLLKRIQQAIVLSAVAAGVAALTAGRLLAETFTRPIRELTEATQAIAQGQLGGQVSINQRDELGTLAIAFNQMSADLDRTNKLRRQMTADIAHDLRTPLSVLLGYTEGLSDGKLKGNLNTYNVMHRETMHLNSLVSDLRLLSLADAGELSLNCYKMAPADLLERSAAAYWVQAEEKGISLTVDAAGDLPQILVDPERMARVLNNLVSNALRYTPSGGRITLGAAADEVSVTLSVRDTGQGIAQPDLGNVFERFYRGDPARQHNGESGLGLAIVKSLVEAHGGSVSVESIINEGATFIISLPIPEA